MRVTLLAPNVANPGAFYDIFADFVRVAARQLAIDLEVVDGTKQRETMLARGRAIAKASPRPDYVLLANYMGVGQDLVADYSAAGIASFFVVERLSDAELQTSGMHAGYLGQLAPDDVEAGRMLAEILTEAARSRGLRDETGKIQVGAIAGEHTPSGNARFRGWQSVLKANPDVVQAGFQYGAWEEQPAKAAAALMLRSTPQIKALWCANDSMALGALAAALEAGRQPGRDILIGGVDLLDRALAEVAAGRLEVSIGGHIVDGVRALLLLYDHHQKHDLTPESRATHLVAVRSAEAHRYVRFIHERAWHGIDFTRFSTVKNPAAKDITFSLETLIQG